MSARRRVNGRPLPRRGKAGYSIIEMVIAIGMAMVVGAGLFAVYNAQQRSSRKQREFITLQTDCNLVMDQVKQELLLAGYRAAETDTVTTFTAADAGTVTFEYFDDNAKFNDASPSEPEYDPGVPWDSQYSEHTQVRFLLNGANLERKIKRWHRATSTYTNEATQTIADNIQALAFEFDSGDNTSIGLPASASDLEEIRNVKINLTCRSAKTDTVSGKQQMVTLTGSVAPRNVGLEASPKDTTAPGIPSGLVAWDPGACNSLELRWSANTETDLDGYTIFYGLDAGSYSKRARLSRGPGTAGQKEYYQLTGLTPTKYTDATPATYHIVITAYDKSGNQSSYSPPVTNPSMGNSTGEPDLALSGSANSDTTINPTAPLAPTNFTVNAKADTENELFLQWDTSTADSLEGYRLYRDETSAGFTPSGTVKGQGNCIAGTAELDAAKTEFTDTGLTGCKTYYYKLAAINCDPTLPIASQYFAPGQGDPGDETPPTLPQIVARAGYGRITLSLKNGTDDDFDYTRIYFNEDDVGSNNYPTIDTDGVVSAQAPIPDSYPYPGTKGAGVFDNTGTQGGIDFNDKTDGDPTNFSPGLDLAKEYYFLAVSYDLCGNHTNADPIAQTAGVQCSDCVPPTDPVACEGPPPDFPSAIGTAGCYGNDGITLSWSYPYLSQASITGDYRDLAGFHVWRRDGVWSDNAGEVELTLGTPIWFTDFTDATAEDGRTYSYRVQVTDCFWEEHHDDDAAAALNSAEAFTSGLYIGRPVFQPFYGTPYARLVSVGSTVPIAVEVRSLAYLAENFPLFEDPISHIKTFDVMIDAEQFQCASASGVESTDADGQKHSTFTDCTRGANSTVISDHEEGSLVSSLLTSPPVDSLTGLLYATTAADLFQHNTVRTKFDNAAPGSLDTTAVTGSWQSELDVALRVRLYGALLGDGNTTAVNTFSGSASSGAPFSLAGGTLAARDEDIPFNLTFKDAGGTVTATSDMRGEELTLKLEWTNPTMTSSSCSISETRAVPVGPIVSSVTMNQPADGTVAVTVPGNPASPTPPGATIVPGTSAVDVFVDILDTSLAGLKEVKLFYAIDSSNALTEPPPLVGTYPSYSGYTAIDLAYVAGDEWRTPAATPPTVENPTGTAADPIPANDGASVWFFIVALDNNGNFDREPEIDRGAFQYYQQQGDVCDNTPNPPSLSGYDGDGKVTLYVAADPHNTDGTWQSDFNGYKIYRSSGSTWSLWREIPLGSTDPIEDTSSDLSTVSYSYYATSLDLCAPPNESTASSIFTECIGAPTCDISLASTANPLHPGNSFGIALNVCSHQGGSPSETLWVQACSSSAGDCNPIRMLESGDTGRFTIDPAYVPGRTEVTTTSAAGATNLDLRVSNTDTVTVRGFDIFASTVPPEWDSSPQTLLPCSASIGVVPDPCASPVVPTMGAVTPWPSSCTANGAYVRLTWALPAAGTYSYFRVYRCNGANCEPAAPPYADNVTTDASTTLADFQWLDTTPGGKLNNTAVRLWYKVTAVNDSCPTNVQETPLSSVTKVSDQCGTN